jgi:hypothetical protein
MAEHYCNLFIEIRRRKNGCLNQRVVGKALNDEDLKKHDLALGREKKIGTRKTSL